MTEKPKKVILKNIVTLSKGKPPAAFPYYGVDACLYLTPEFLRGGSYAALAKPASNAVYVNNGDTILLWDGSNAGECFQGRRGLLASTMTLVKHGDEFDKQYFLYSLKHWESYLKGQTSGSGIPHVDKEVLGNLEILLLAKQEQTQIATVLSTIDRAIEQTEAIIAKQQRIKTGLMQDLLTKGIDEDGNVRSEATHAFKDSVVGRIPSEWTVKKIAESGEVKLGRQTAPKYKLGINSCPYLRVINISENRLDLRDIKSMDFTPDEFKKYCLNPGDVLLTEGDLVSAMNVGRSAVFRGEIEGCCFQNSLIRFRPFLEETAEYFHFAFCYLRSIGYFANATMATTVFHLSAGRLKELYLLIPDIEEQLHISRMLFQQDEAIDTDLKKREKLLALKTGLMQDLLTGNVRVTALLSE